MTKTLFAASMTTLALLVPAIALRAADQVMTPQHVAKLRTVTTAEISPDGQFVAYTLSVPRKPWEEATGGSYEELRVVDRKGGTRAFITGEVNVSAIRFSRDGKSITYLAKRNGEKNTSLYRIPVDGGESQKVLSHDVAINSYSFSPDETQVAFLASEPENEKLKKAKEKGFDAEVYEEQLRFTRVYIAAATPGTNKPRVLDLPGNASALDWSAADRLTVALAPTPLVDDDYMARRVRVVDVASGKVVGEISNPGKLGAVRLSPDGKFVAMISGQTINDPHDGCLMVAPASGGAPKDLLPDIEGHVSAFAWADADTLVYLADFGTTTALESIDADGSNRTLLLPSGKYALTGLTRANDGTVATTYENGRHPREVAVIASNGEFTQLTDHNEWIPELSLAQQEVVKFKARDGLEIEGILVRPLNEVRGQRYPLILCVHGGPEAHVKDGFVTSYSNPGQMAAARGMAVFYPNYRGSTGRGVKFSRLGQGDFGGKEFDDLVDSADYFIKNGLADEKKIGITGGSYGGYATAWCSTKHSERFAAGVMFVGISDQISKFGTTDIPSEMYLVHENERPWENWQKFIERSPIRYVEQARTPLLIMHGKDDPRVHPSQSLELYRMLKVYGKTPVRLVWYPGEGHGNRKSASRFDYSLRMLQWFEHYLKGPGGPPPSPELDYGFDPPANAKQ